MTENANELLVKFLSRIDDKLTDVINRLGKLESSHEQIDHLQSANAKHSDKLAEHDIRLTKIETKGAMIAGAVAVAVSLAVGLVTVLFKTALGGGG